MKTKTVQVITLAMSNVLAAASTSAFTAGSSQKEKYFDLSLKEKNECKTCAGASKVNYQGDAVKLVLTGRCIRTVHLPVKVS